MAPAFGTTDRLIERVRAEYREMPGLRLTARQAARLWRIEADHSESILQALVADGFLARTDRGAYVRRGCPRCS